MSISGKLGKVCVRGRRCDGLKERKKERKKESKKERKGNDKSDTPTGKQTRPNWNTTARVLEHWTHTHTHTHTHTLTHTHSHTHTHTHTFTHSHTPPVAVAECVAKWQSQWFIIGRPGTRYRVLPSFFFYRVWPDATRVDESLWNWLKQLQGGLYWVLPGFTGFH